MSELHAARGERGRVSALLFFCGVKYFQTYREANGRRLSHYLDDGLREAVEHTLPALMKRCGQSPLVRLPGTRLRNIDGNLEFAQLVFGFSKLHQRWPASTVHWFGATPDSNLIRLVFGMGVAARFAPDSHEFLRRMLEQPLLFAPHVQDVLDSFQWHPEWSVTLTA